MKYLALLFLFGVAAANFHEELERARDEALLSFLEGMEKAPSLSEAMDLPFLELSETEDDIKTELGKHLREKLDELMEKFKEAVDHGKVIKESLKEKIKETVDKLKELHEDIGGKAKELFERLKQKVKDKFKELYEKLKEKMGWQALAEHQKRSAREVLDWLKGKMEEGKSNMEELFNEMREKFKNNKIVKVLEAYKEKGLEKLKEIVNKLIGKESRAIKESRAMKDMYEKMKDYIKEVSENVKHRFSDFLDWLKKVYKSGSDAAKDRLENVKKVAQKFIDHAKEVSKKTADEALEFFRPYKEDLGTLWEQLKKSVKEIHGEIH